MVAQEKCFFFPGELRQLKSKVICMTNIITEEHVGEFNLYVIRKLFREFKLLAGFSQIYNTEEKLEEVKLKREKFQHFNDLN